MRRRCGRNCRGSIYFSFIHQLSYNYLLCIFNSQTVIFFNIHTRDEISHLLCVSISNMLILTLLNCIFITFIFFLNPTVTGRTLFSQGPFKYDLTPEGGGGSKILEKCEDHYIKSHKKCEDGGGLSKKCEIIFEWPLRWLVVNCVVRCL